MPWVRWKESSWTPQIMEIIMFRAAPLTANLSMNQTSHRSGTAKYSTQHPLVFLHSRRTPHFQTLLTSQNSSVIRHAISSTSEFCFLKNKKKAFAAEQCVKSWRVEASCCAHFTVLNVSFYPRFRWTGAGWMRRRASLRSLMVWFSNPVRGFSGCAEEIPASQAPFNRIHSQHEAPTRIGLKPPYVRDQSYSSLTDVKKKNTNVSAK